MFGVAGLVGASGCSDAGLAGLVMVRLGRLVAEASPQIGTAEAFAICFAGMAGVVVMRAVATRRDSGGHGRWRHGADERVGSAVGEASAFVRGRRRGGDRTADVFVGVGAGVVGIGPEIPGGRSGLAGALALGRASWGSGFPVASGHGAFTSSSRPRGSM